MSTTDEKAEALAKERLILKLFKLYRYLDGKADRGLTNTYLEPVMRFSTEAIALAYQSIHDGGVPEAMDWLPTIPRWVTQVRRFERPAAPVGLYNGLLEMDFGHGRVDMRGLTSSEQDTIIKQNGLTLDGRNMALLSLDEKRGGLRALSAPANKTVKLPEMRRI